LCGRKRKKTKDLIKLINNVTKFGSEKLFGLIIDGN